MKNQSSGLTQLWFLINLRGLTPLVLKAPYSMPEKFDMFQVQLASNKLKSQRDRPPNLPFITRGDVGSLFNVFQFPHTHIGDKISPCCGFI